jgi:hypothetical protein
MDGLGEAIGATESSALLHDGTGGELRSVGVRGGRQSMSMHRGNRLESLAAPHATNGVVSSVCGCAEAAHINDNYLARIGLIKHAYGTFHWTNVTAHGSDSVLHIAKTVSPTGVEGGGDSPSHINVLRVAL